MPATTAATRSGGRRPRRRTRTALIAAAATLAVTATGMYVAYQLSNGLNDKDTSTSDTSDTSATPTPALPTGWQPWQANLTQPVKDSPVTNVDTVESGCVTGGSASALYCAGTGFTVARVAAATGDVEWRFGSTSQAAERPLGVRDGLVYVHVQPNEDSVYSTQQLVAVDTDTGKRSWTTTVDAGYPAALFNGGLLAMSNEGTEFVAVDAKTGKDLWRTPAKSSAGTACAPAVLGGAPYGICVNADDPFKGDAALLRLDPAKGTARELGGLPLTAEPLGAVGGQPLFAERQSTDTESDDGRDEPYKNLLRVNPTTGTVTRLPLKGTPRGTPTVVGGAVYFVRPDGTVIAVSASKGTQLWKQSTQIENLSAPVLSKKYDDLYFVNRYGRLLALDRESGTEQWNTDKLNDPGSSAEARLPSVTLAKDAVVGVAGDMAFSVRPDAPEARPSAPATAS
ncbi:PQQ-binding-like beta-propeller repeat protein [Streptomyces spongiae]|uniref:PQQ-binding-like beta-propeller repeat protein n=1 Tax=Streptomyces spongiae TaxID=565072 RepID=A0A5N8XR93_9ACTN|nr:PQQ-binding-like beta-propeller repeat protein [Streptomyces spongiae]